MTADFCSFDMNFLDEDQPALNPQRLDSRA